ncbi:TetR/AcrR family transcriptional regulator [Lacticaseibacillus parakribbianus]|uniref:TetR/AcrR family transcriptional regulator n=1 Tax=Lacticaseibacillus parakribbianus TaxID=2970927 RepID=UPI0021CB07B0|nr:TetR/AcrR family transcriptional regulator [Lacticaseibacillus parakribbianus]
MVGTKNNRRTQYTKQRLRDAMVSLLATQPLAKITVTQLCAVADVNRGTFYAHYQDPTDLFHAIEADLIATIRPLLSDRPLPDWLPQVLAVIAKEEAATQIIIRNLDDSPLLQAILAPIRQRTLAEYQHLFHEDDPAVLNYYFEFCLSGAVRVITSWLRGGAKETPAQIAAVIGNLSPL